MNAPITTATLPELIECYIAESSPKAVLITGPPGSGKTTLVNQALATTTLPIKHLCSDILTDPEITITKLFHSKQAITFDSIDLYCPHTPSPLENRLIAALTYALSHTTCLFIATATNTALLHPVLLQRITHLITLDALTYQQRLEASNNFGEYAPKIAEVTPGFLWSDLIRLHNHLSTVPVNELLNALPTILRTVRPSLLSSHDTVQVTLLHGLSDQIKQLEQVLYTVFYSSDTQPHRALQRIGTFRGILIHGKTGCGKTALARMGKQLVKEHTVNFVDVSATEVVGSIIGEGERNLRRLFTIARAIAPCVIIIDNIDIIAPKRREDSGAGTKAFERVLSTLLVLIDGVVRDDRKVLVIGTTRNLQLVDSALLRPGRFDLHIHVHPPNADARIKIMQDFLTSRGLEASDAGIDPNFGEISDGWTAPDVIAYARKKVLQTKANFI